MKTFQINPINGRKSFYNKCRVNELNNVLTLVSYTTEVATFNKETGVLWITKNENFLTRATLTHINGFLSFIDRDAMTKKQILNS